MRHDHLDSIEPDALFSAGSAVVSREEVIPQAVARSNDAAFINAVVNDPSVRPFVGPLEIGELDLSAVVARPENICLVGRYGGFLLVWSAPGVHEVHTFIVAAGRGDWARKARAESIAYARAQGVTMLWTKIPLDQPNVAAFAEEGGMRSTGFMIETFGKPYLVYKMELA